MLYDRKKVQEKAIEAIQQEITNEIQALEELINNSMVEIEILNQKVSIYTSCNFQFSNCGFKDLEDAARAELANKKQQLEKLIQESHYKMARCERMQDYLSVKQSTEQ